MSLVEFPVKCFLVATYLYLIINPLSFLPAHRRGRFAKKSLGFGVINPQYCFNRSTEKTFRCRKNTSRHEHGLLLLDAYGYGTAAVATATREPADQGGVAPRVDGNPSCSRRRRPGRSALPPVRTNLGEGLGLPSPPPPSGGKHPRKVRQVSCGVGWTEIGVSFGVRSWGDCS